MPASPADSQLYGPLFGDAETARLFSDSAEVRAMLLVEGALAKVQGERGVIPPIAGAFLHRMSLEVQIDPAALGAATAVNGVPVPALIEAFRKEAGAPEHSAYLHWGATSQDILDTALALRMRPVLDLLEARLDMLIRNLQRLALDHADLAMTARTYGQAATPTTFGAVAASWGRPLLRHRERLAPVRAGVLQVSLSGAAGTLSALGDQGPAVRAALALELGLHDPGADWHSERDGIVALAGWLAGLCASLGKLGEDLILLTQTGIAEVSLSATGGSSTMPQKQNPVGPSVLVALARQAIALCGALQGAGLHRQQRDGAAWFTEWLSLPQLCILTARALSLSAELSAGLAPDPVTMARNLAADSGLIHAEALTFVLARQMPRPEAAAAVKALVDEARASGRDLLDLARARWPTVQLAVDTGLAVEEARSFANAKPERA
jgi:3-carboxy-cis,cis-muconate cycloisomerase